MIYLDYAANTPTDPKVLQSFCEANQKFIGNPNSKHGLGKEAKAELERITAQIAQLLHVSPKEIIYTSGASEANNLAIKGLARAYRGFGKHIISTCLEHSSVSGTLTSLQEQGYEIELVDIKSDGAVNLTHLEELLRKDTVLVSVSLVDGELGVVQPIKEISDVLKKFPNCRFHVDATQAFGKIDVNPEDVDCISFAPHKFFGLNGCGVLIKREGVALEPLIHGGASTTLYRSGTPDVSMAASIEIALRLAIENLSERNEHVAQLNKNLRSALEKFPLVRINSTERSVPHIINLSVKGVKAFDFQQALDAHGICVSTKSACSTQSTPSRPVFAVSRDKKNAMSSWRISLSHLTTETEINQFLNIFENCYKELTK